MTEKVQLLFGQRCVPSPVAHNAVLEGFAVHVAQLDLQESHPCVGILADAHLVSDVFATDVVFQAVSFWGVEVQVVVNRRNLISDGKNTVFAQALNEVFQPCHGHDILGVKAVHQRHGVNGLKPEGASALQKLMELRRQIAGLMWFALEATVKVQRAMKGVRCPGIFGWRKKCIQYTI